METKKRSKWHNKNQKGFSGLGEAALSVTLTELTKTSMNKAKTQIEFNKEKNINNMINNNNQWILHDVGISTDFKSNILPFYK